MESKFLKLNKILGSYFNYPKCCVSDFVKRNSEDKTINKEIRNNLKFTSAGYIPCCSCYIKLKNLSKEEIKLKFKRNIYKDQSTMDFLKITYEKEFIDLSNKLNFPIKEYRNYLIKKIKNY